MNETTAKQLIDLNRQFYQTFALQFSATRQRLQPGVRRVLDGIESTARILDLGCGNGELARELARRSHNAIYVGLDFSSKMLDHATLPGSPNIQEENLAPANQHFLQADLSEPDWDAQIPSTPFDIVLAFAVLHHLPGEELRVQVLRKVHRLLVGEGHFIHSEWQFLNSRRLIARLRPWSEAGLAAADVDPGDYLLDWRRGGMGIRYVHLFTEDELADLAEKTGFQVLDTFHSDGEGGNLGLYQLWGKL